MMEVWESSYEIYSYAEMVPEVVGTQREIIRGGAVQKAKITTPPPKCSEIGYTAWEWLRHWKDEFDLILPIPAESYRQECMCIIRKKLAG